MAWVYVRYLREPALAEVEREAREASRGLWVNAEPVAPWEWRQQRR